MFLFVKTPRGGRKEKVVEEWEKKLFWMENTEKEEGGNVWRERERERERGPIIRVQSAGTIKFTHNNSMQWLNLESFISRNGNAIFSKPERKIFEM